MRPTRRTLLAGALGTVAARPSSALARPGRAASIDGTAFARLLATVRAEAAAAGISAATVETALGALAPDQAVLARAARQGEFSVPVGRYVEGAAAASRVTQGRERLGRWAGLLDGLERRFGVPPAIVVAVWGVESGFGQASGDFDTLRSLATLALSGERTAYFRAELVAALRILDGGHIARAAMKGSWAGATGQTQFMPSSYLRYAADGDGDGVRDIWTSVPDVLASIANFLAESGWIAGLPWGFEARLPDGLDLSVHERDLGEWSRLGLSRGGGGALPLAGRGRLFLPAGIAGPAFILTDNFEALRAYNTSDAYGLGIGVLADRLAGGGPLARRWPSGPGLTGDERREVHRRLAALGFYAGTPDGKFGAQTRDAVRRFQIGRGLVPDGHADGAVLAALRETNR